MRTLTVAGQEGNVVVLAVKPGRVVQVDPVKPVLKAPGSMLLKLRCDGPLSNVAFNFNLRRYSLASARRSVRTRSLTRGAGRGRWRRSCGGRCLR